MRRRKQISSTVAASMVVVSIVAAVAVLGAAVSPVAADQHTFEEAPDMTESGNFTITHISQSDHYPGNMNEENGSIEYHADLGTSLEELGAENGTWGNVVIVSADWIDYTACTTENTVVFGLDRGANLSGTKYDEDLVQHRRDDNFRDDGLTVYFYNWDDFSGNPPYIAPGDEIVSAQGEGSNGGGCLTYTSEPGWYQMQGFLNGTEANADCTEEGNPECKPPESREVKGGFMKTLPYFYICECDSRQEAREKLGPPPNEQTSSDTPTPTPTETQTSDDTPTPTETQTSDDTPTATETQGGGSSQNNDGGDSGAGTPTPGAGPGFGPVVAILALLASALLANRRR